MGREIFLDEHIQPGAELLRRFGDLFPVKVAFWMMLEGDGEPYLYIASDEFTDQNIDAADQKVIWLSHEIHTFWVDPYHVQLIKGDDPKALDALRFRPDDPRPPRRLGSHPLAGRLTQDLYIYPPAHVPVA